MATSIFPSAGSGGTPGGSSGDLQYNNAGAFGGYTPGTGVVTWLQTPSSANLAAAVTDETGSGALVFGTSPTLTTPNIGVATATTLTITTTATQNALNASTSLTAATGDQTAYTLAYTVNKATSGTTVGLDINCTDTLSPGINTPLRAWRGASAGTVQVTDDNNGGFYYLSIPSDGSSNGLALSAGTLQVSANFELAWGTGSNTGRINGVGMDVGLSRDAAGVLAQRRSTTAQAHRIYNTYTSSTSYERLDIDWQTTANVCLIGAQKGSGGGTARVMSLVYGGTSTAAVTVPITSGNIVFGGGVQLSNAAVTGLVGGALAATTNASIVIYDSTGQAYRVPCII